MLALWPYESTLAALWFWFTLLIGIVWLRRHVELNRSLREPPLSPDAAPGGLDDPPRLSVLVAAKDEQANIARCLDGLLAQDYPWFELIAVNDRSTDRTAQIVDSFAQRDQRLKAVHVRELPAGWFGKNHAMYRGLQQATGDWLCFTDADCTYESRRLLSVAVAEALRRNVEFLSVLPNLETHSVWEKIVQPVAGGIMMFWNAPAKVNDPRSRAAYANGAFMLITRRAYDAIGGHAAVRNTLNEDMHFARRAKAAGIRLRVETSVGLIRVRMYDGFGQIWRGWSRIFYGCFGTVARLIASLVLLSVFSLSPYVTLVVAALSGLGWQLAVAAGVAMIAQQSVLWRFYSATGSSSAWALSYPVGTVVCLGITFDALGKTRSNARTSWRGTSYSGGAAPAEV